MKKYIEERAAEIASYIVENHAFTVVLDSYHIEKNNTLCKQMYIYVYIIN